MRYNAIRFISQYEYDILMSGADVGYLNKFKAWDGRKSVFLFPITDYYKPHMYYPIAKHLSKELGLWYDYIVYLDVPQLYTHFAAYDKAAVDSVNEGIDILFDVDEEAYDTGPVYVVPEYRIKVYNKRNVVKVEPIGSLLENKNNEEAINNMPEKEKDLEVIDKITLGVNSNEDSEVSFMNMYLQLVDAENVDKAVFRRVLAEIDWVEEVGYRYLDSELKVHYTRIPVITGGVLDVKLVKVEQADNIGLIVPSEVAKTYQTIDEAPELITEVNAVENIAFETYGFDTNDEALLELVAKIFVETGNEAPAFALTTAGDIEAVEEDLDNIGGRDMGLGSDASFGASNENLFDTIEDLDIDTAPGIEANLESFKKFKKTTKALNLLEAYLFDNIPKAIRNYVRTKYFAENKLLAIQVDNSSIFETYNNLPRQARNILTTIGELVKAFNNVQLVDSVLAEGKRIFVVAEAVNNNYWMVDGEATSLLEKEDKKHKVVIPNKSDIIILKESNVRLGSRKVYPVKNRNKTAFVDTNKIR